MYTKNNIIRTAATFVVLTAVLMLAGCPLQTGGGDKWDKAAALSNDFAQALGNVQDIEINAFHEGLVPLADHVEIEKALINVAQAGKVLDSAIKNGHDAHGTVEAFNVAVDAVEQALHSSLLHIKNPDTLQKMQIGLLSAKGFLDTMKLMAAK